MTLTASTGFCCVWQTCVLWYWMGPSRRAQWPAGPPTHFSFRGLGSCSALWPFGSQLSTKHWTILRRITGPVTGSWMASGTGRTGASALSGWCPGNQLFHHSTAPVKLCACLYISQRMSVSQVVLQVGCLSYSLYSLVTEAGNDQMRDSLGCQSCSKSLLLLLLLFFF